VAPSDAIGLISRPRLFAPVAAWLAAGKLAADKIEPTTGLRVRLGADNLAEMIYIDHYGNGLTGMRSGTVPRDAKIEVRGRQLAYARFFAEAPAGNAFWYENSIGLSVWWRSLWPEVVQPSWSVCASAVPS
jgi:S-adenosylmethionine hydrolase